MNVRAACRLRGLFGFKRPDLFVYLGPMFTFVPRLPLPNLCLLNCRKHIKDVRCLGLRSSSSPSTMCLPCVQRAMDLSKEKSFSSIIDMKSTKISLFFFNCFHLLLFLYIKLSEGTFIDHILIPIQYTPHLFISTSKV